MPKPIRVALVEDQLVTREGLSLLIGSSPGFEICGQYESMEHALEQIRGTPPDVLLADIGLPGMSGIDGVWKIHEKVGNGRDEVKMANCVVDHIGCVEKAKKPEVDS